MKSVLITGGAGFLGLHLAKYFSERGWRIRILDIADLDIGEYPKVDFIKGDVRDTKIVDKSVRGVDLVIHAAAALPLQKKKEILEINIQGSANVFDACLKYKTAKVVYISSTAVYGIPKHHPIVETDQLIGVGPYGESKILSEKLCNDYRKKGLIITVLRPKTFVGTHRLGVFAILYDWISDGKPIPVIGSGQNKYQLLDVDDLVTAIYKISQVQDIDKINTEFNIGSQKFETVKKDLEALFHSVGSRSRVISTWAFFVKLALRIFEILKLSPLYQWVYDTADKDSYVSIEKIQKALSWTPKYSNSEALIKSYKWYKRHYQQIKSRGVGTTHTLGWKQGILAVIKKVI